RAWAYIKDHDDLPKTHQGGGVKSAMDDNDFAQELHLHLQQVGKYVKAEDILCFCKSPEVLSRIGRTKNISLSTAKNWMWKMGYCWQKNPKGQYVDGHECKDVVDYRQKGFLTQMAVFEVCMCLWIEGIGWSLP
ncbi:hypothetical protein EDD18DRAFT_1090483, partial [Armillaria luteobubalina]